MPEQRARDHVDSLVLVQSVLSVNILPVQLPTTFVIPVPQTTKYVTWLSNSQSLMLWFKTALVLKVWSDILPEDSQYHQIRHIRLESLEELTCFSMEKILYCLFWSFEHQSSHNAEFTICTEELNRTKQLYFNNTAYILLRKR